MNTVIKKEELVKNSNHPQNGNKGSMSEMSRTKDDIREEIVQTQRWIREWCDWTYQYRSGVEKINRLKRELKTIKN